MTDCRLSQGVLLGLLLVFTWLWFGNLNDRVLIQPDEGRYAEIAREMAQSGDWVTPRLNDLKYFEKPPLQYWATAIAFRTFGEHEWTARGWPAMTAFIAVLFMFYAGQRLYDTATGLTAAAALGGCSWFLFNAHLNTLDTGLTVFLTVGLLAFLLAQRPEATSRENRHWMLTVWAALALAVLSKGLVGLVLPGAVLTLYILIERDWRLLTRLHLVSGLALFLLITAPWFIAVSLANDEFAHFFFIHEHFERFLTTTHKREGGWGYFIPMLLFGAMPWTPFIAVRLSNGWRHQEPAQTFQPLRLLLIWTGFIFLFFSASSSKLPSYILPVFPALALFIAVEMQRMKLELLSRITWGLAMISGSLWIVVLFGGESLARSQVTDSRPFAMVWQVVPWAQASVAAFTVGAVAATWLLRRYQRTVGIVALALGNLSAGVLAMYGHNELSRLYSTVHLVRESEAHYGSFDPAVPFYSIHRYDQSLPFYLQRPLILVQHVDEFALGLAAEPHKGIPSVAEWKLRWQALDRGYAVMSPDYYQQFITEGLPMHVLARDPRRVLVSR